MFLFVALSGQELCHTFPAG